jgi:hypothetical protein
MSGKRREGARDAYLNANIFVFVAVVASTLAFIVVAAWSMPVTESFVIPLGPFGVATFRNNGFGIDLEDRDGGFHGVALSYYAGRKYESASWHFLRTHITPEQRAKGYTYIGWPECPDWGFVIKPCGF